MSNRVLNDEEIVRMFFAREERAIAETRNKYGSYLKSLSFNLLRDRGDSEECVSDVLLALWNAIPPEAPLRLGAYAAKITRNLSFKRLRERTAKKRGGGSDDALSELDGCIPSEDCVESAADARELSRAIDSFLSTLEKTERVIFVRRYWYCDRVRDIARRTGSTESKVKMTLFRAREKLKKRLTEEGIFI